MDADLRHEAIKRIKEKRDFKGHLAAYVIVNAALVAIWALSGQGYFWPVWSIFGWGIGLAFHAVAAYGPRKQISEADIDREVERMRRGHR